MCGDLVSKLKIAKFKGLYSRKKGKWQYAAFYIAEFFHLMVYITSIFAVVFLKLFPTPNEMSVWGCFYVYVDDMKLWVGEWLNSITIQTYLLYFNHYVP